MKSRMKLTQKAVFQLNRLNNRIRKIGEVPTRIADDDGIDHLLRHAAYSDDIKTRQLFRTFLHSVEDDSTIERITQLIPKEQLKRVV